jgi:preprotein translocase subunit SecA
MITWIKSFLGFSDEKKVAEYWQQVKVINALEPQISALPDEAFAQRTHELKQQIADKQKTLHQVLPEAFALVREAAKRKLGMRHYDVQLIGGMVLNDGKIAEMKTGEGKTLVATLAAYLNALSGHQVHVVTVNDYLASRDSKWMTPVYEFLGLSVGSLQSHEELAKKKENYSKDILYGTNNEFGFDYLRDHMVLSPEQIMQKKLAYAIVDEVDSILIDEARTPLIISGSGSENTKLYFQLLSVAKVLENEKHFKKEEKTKHIHLTEEGIDTIEKKLNIEHLYSVGNMDKAHVIVQLLRALHLFQIDVDYVVQEGQVVIVDEFTGRLMEGRRYGDGLHQALEAKENVKIQQESQTLATVTFQNFFRLYEKISGMTGTAKTEEGEFLKIYNLEVIQVPTHQNMIRKDQPDIIYKTQREKFKAVTNEIIKAHQTGQPVLVGTVAIETSEMLSQLLKARQIPHHVLNAKNHAREAEIIAGAGQKSAVTIATNMAGRGTDIVLGEGVKDLGGLYIIGTNRHESRRIDNQLRGRAGRQGDPGLSRFFISLDDDLMRLFGGGKIAAMMDRFQIPEDTPIEHGLISGQIERAQKKVEQYYFGVRKQVLEFDDVMERQRRTLYRLRQRVLHQSFQPDDLKDFVAKVSEALLSPMIDDLRIVMELKEPVATAIKETVPVQIEDSFFTAKTPDELKNKLNVLVTEAIEKRRAALGSEVFLEILRVIFLRTMDTKWIEHLRNMDTMREGIGLRAYGQQDPLMAYKMEGFKMFEGLMRDTYTESINLVFRAEMVTEPVAQSEYPVNRLQFNDPSQALESSSLVNAARHYGNPDSGRDRSDNPRVAATKQQPIHAQPTVGRNDPCPCGSGKKYKKCHGVLETTP